MFADAATTRRAIAGSGHPLTPEELNSAPDDMDQVMTDANLDPAGQFCSNNVILLLLLLLHGPGQAWTQYRMLLFGLSVALTQLCVRSALHK